MCSPDELSELIDFSSGCDDTPMVGTPILNNSANHCFKGLLNSISITGSDYPVSRRGVQGLNLNNPDYFVSTQRLKELFRIFCKSRGLKPLDENILGKELIIIMITRALTKHITLQR